MEGKAIVILILILIISITTAGFSGFSIFLTLVIIFILIKNSKLLAKDAWQEFKDAKPEDGTKRLKKYAKSTSEMAADLAHAKYGTQAQMTSPAAVQKGSKSLMDELKDIFKS